MIQISLLFAILGIATLITLILIVIALIAYFNRNKDTYEKKGMIYIKIHDGIYVNFESLLLTIIILIIAIVFTLVYTN